MTSGHEAIDLVIQTASGLLVGRFGPREAVTLLATQAPQARAEAPKVRDRVPERADAYVELLQSICAELAPKVDRDVREVVTELERVASALKC